MVNDLRQEATSPAGGLESLVIEHPPGPESRKSLLLLVTGRDEQGFRLQRELVKMGYIVANLPTLALAAQYLNRAYVDGVIVDALNSVLTRKDVGINPDAYRSGTGEIFTFLAQLHSIDPKLGVLLVTTSSDPDEYHAPAINDLIQLGVKVTIGIDKRFRPFAAD